MCNCNLIIWLLKKASTDAWTRVLIFLAEEMAKQTSNDLDDEIVNLIKSKLKNHGV